MRFIKRIITTLLAQLGDVIRPGFRAGSRPLKEDESYEYGCEAEAVLAAPVLA